MLEPASINGAGWYRDPRDDRGVRFHDGKRWTGNSQPGAARMLGGRASRRPRAAMTRSELEHRQTVVRWTMLGQEVDLYL